MSMIRVFIGYDSKEKVAFSTLSYSILKNSSLPVSITPIYLGNLKHTYRREKHKLSSTDFSFSRFLVPYLMEYKGWAIFMDCDMLMKGDIAELWELRDNDFAAQVCKHDYVPRNRTKFLNQVQTVYTKKNWSSLMLLNCARCTTLTPQYVNTASGLELHQFKWLEDEAMIGEIPLEWNWLVGEYEFREDVKNVHYTEGGPYFKDSSTSDYSEEWFDYYRETTEVNLA